MPSVHSRAARTAGIALLALFAALGTGLIAAGPAAAVGTNRYVSTTGDDTENDCTDAQNPCEHVQHAVDAAEVGDTVSIAAGTYDESVHVRTSLTLLGAGTSGANDTVIDGAGEGDPSIFVDGLDTNSPPNVTIKDLDVSGNSDDDGILVDFADATVIDCVVSQNDRDGIRVEDDSTVAVQGTTVSDNGNEGIVLDFGRRALDAAAKRAAVLPHVTVTNSVVNGNADGGVIVEQGRADVTRTTLNHNTGAGMVLDGGGTHGSLTASTVSNTVPFSDTGGEAFGGGVLVFPGGQVSIDTSTIDRNTGQGVLNWAGTVTIDNSTVSGTTGKGSSSGGPEDLPFGGIAVNAVVPQVARPGKTSYARTATAGVLPAGRLTDATTVTGSIVADNAAGDCNGSSADGGYNLDSDGSCGWSATGSISNGHAKLGALADNGGPTKTRYPAKTSDAVDQIPLGSANCKKTATDQRDVTRPQGARCDIGAVEADQTPIVIHPAKLPRGTVGKPYSTTITASGGLGPPYAISLVAGEMPPGLSFGDGGVISGKPTQAGHFPITVSVDDPVHKQYVIVIDEAATAPTSTAAPSSPAPIANTGANTKPLAGFGVTSVVVGVLFMVAAGWLGRERYRRAH